MRKKCQSWEKIFNDCKMFRMSCLIGYTNSNTFMWFSLDPNTNLSIIQRVFTQLNTLKQLHHNVLRRIHLWRQTIAEILSIIFLLWEVILSRKDQTLVKLFDVRVAIFAISLTSGKRLLCKKRNFSLQPFCKISLISSNHEVFSYSRTKFACMVAAAVTVLNR